MLGACAVMHILVVEDDASWLQLVRMMLEGAGHKVSGFSDYRGALDLIESSTAIDLVDAAHPQTILAYDMNGQPLPVAHGAPLRLRLERQLGYKMAKYVSHIEAVASYADIGSGRGGFWEDRGYQWYAGI